jgi:hypothetical protein
MPARETVCDGEAIAQGCEGFAFAEEVDHGVFCA